MRGIIESSSCKCGSGNRLAHFVLPFRLTLSAFRTVLTDFHHSGDANDMMPRLARFIHRPLFLALSASRTAARSTGALEEINSNTPKISTLASKTGAKEISGDSLHSSAPSFSPYPPAVRTLGPPAHRSSANSPMKRNRWRAYSRSAPRWRPRAAPRPRLTGGSLRACVFPPGRRRPRVCRGNRRPACPWNRRALTGCGRSAHPADSRRQTSQDRRRGRAPRCERCLQPPPGLGVLGAGNHEDVPTGVPDALGGGKAAHIDRRQGRIPRHCDQCGKTDVAAAPRAFRKHGRLPRGPVQEALVMRLSPIAPWTE
jgi:hypothetical protein